MISREALAKALWNPVNIFLSEVSLGTSSAKTTTISFRSKYTMALMSNLRHFVIKKSKK